MKNFYSKTVTLLLAFILTAHLAIAQVLNPGFISPIVLRHGETRLIKQVGNGQLYVVGDFNFHGNDKIAQLVRINADGLLDASFKPQIPAGYIRDLDVSSSGNVLVLMDNGNLSGVYVLATNGNRLGFVPMGYPTAVAATPDGGFFMTGQDGDLFKCSSNYAIEGLFALADAAIRDMHVQGPHLVVAGNFSEVYDANIKAWLPRSRLARFNISGGLDLTFNPNAAMSGHQAVFGIHIQPDGKIIPLNNYNVSNSNKNIRLNPDGSRDLSFNYGYPSSLLIEEATFLNDKITITTKSKIVRVNADGSIDGTFKPINYATAAVRTTVLPDQSIIAGNYSNATYGFAKFTSGGNRINEYYARLMRYGEIYSMDIEGSSIYIAGDFMKVGGHFTKNVARLNLNGTILTKFTSPINSPVLTVDGFANAKVLVNTATGVYRLRSDGTIDEAFSYTRISGLPQISKFVVQPDGKILIGGTLKLFRLNANGSRDLTFNAQGGLTADGFTHMDFDLDRTSGKIIYSLWYSSASNPAGYSKKELWRFNSDGSRDLTFSPPAQRTNSYEGITKVLVLDNQEVLLVSDGAFSINGSTHDIIKVNGDGSVNQEFLDNYKTQAGGAAFEQVSRFGDRVILSVYDYYESSSTDEIIFLNGVVDHLALPAGMTVALLNDYYSPDGTNLFVIGNITVDNSTRPYQIVKVGSPTVTASPVARATSEPLAISFYPNPVKDRATVEVRDHSIVNVYDLNGSRRINVTIHKTENVIDLTQLNRGRYIIEIITEGKSYRQHFIKE